ncbi:MAG: sigma-E factor negative regulatory protein [Methylomicrobium sp.]|jgi:sigma-E factor negative regulatory protein RseA|nr:sigma-E factor negative regulatory protein [Methylomicrobium sp.]
MIEELNQKISQLIDNDLDKEEALVLLKKMKQDPVLQAKLSRYETIGHAIKSDVFLSVDCDFAARVNQAIHKEPVYLLPKRKSVFNPNIRLSALAASVALLAVLVSQGFLSYSSSESLNKPSLLIASNTESEPLNSLAQASRPVIPSDRPLETKAGTVHSSVSRFAEYLQAHNSTRYIDGGFERQPYARIVSYSQE